MKIVIVGGGLAAATAATELRDTGYDGDLAVFAAEPHLPYERPPLSKSVLLGDEPESVIFVHDEQWYADHDVELHLGTTVTALDLDGHLVTTDEGSFPFDKLLLATGSQPRHLALADAANPVYLRTLDDSRLLAARLREGVQVVIVGGGWIGLEVASAARHAGAEVTLVETLSLPLLGVLGPEIAQVFADLHREHGVDLRLDARITSIEGAGSDVDGAVVHLEDGSEIAGDLLVVGVGAAPDTALAEAAGLAVDNGVLVDASLRTSHPDVYAVGDVANHDHSALGRVRVEHWDNAIEQAKVAAHNLAGDPSGEAETYDRQPYFFTDQYDLGMEYVGHTSPDEPTDVVTRGDLAGRVFQAFWVKDGLVKAAMQVNDWDASDAIKAIVGRTVDVDKLADETIPLADLG